MNVTPNQEPHGASLVIVDDHGLVLEGMRSLLSTLPGIETLSTARTGSEALALLRTVRADVFIIDIELPDMDGFELIRRIRQVRPRARIVVGTMHEEIWTLCKLADYSVDAVVLKASDLQLLRHAVASVLEGQRYFCPRFREVYDRLNRRRRAAGQMYEAPTVRELEVLKGIARGWTTTEISARLFISDNTVETHRKSLMLKFGARNSADLVMKAVERGFINVPCE